MEQPIDVEKRRLWKQGLPWFIRGGMRMRQGRQSLGGLARPVVSVAAQAARS